MSSQQKFFVVRIKCYELSPIQNAGEINSQVVVKEQGDNKWNEKGKTEVQLNQRNPQFSTSVQLNYQFETSYKVLFEVYNCHQEKKHLIGYTEVNIQTLLAAKDQIYNTDICNKNKKVGRIVLIGEYQKYKNDMVELILCKSNLLPLAADSLSRKCCIFNLQPSQPYIKISRTFQDTNESNLVYQSEPIKFPDRRTWPEIKKMARDICNNDSDAVLQIEIFDKGRSNDIYIGSVNLSISQMLDKKGQRNLQHKGNQCITGQLSIQKCLFREIPTFEQYLQEGLQLNLMISIDFTDSNLEPTNPQSLHYFDVTNRRLSQYEQALRNVSEILIQYDHDKRVPLFGFGFEMDGKAHHCYPLNHNLEDPEVVNILGLFQTYRNFVGTVKFSGPTLFRPTIKEAMKTAKGFKEARSEKYVVLAILTDGIISDFDGAFELIVDCCELPISIVIIGIGDADFTLMERLNNNDLNEIDSQGRKATRDLVKFVVFNNYKNEQKKFAQEVLSELPDQVVNYMSTIGKMPGSREQKNQPFIAQNQQFDQYYQPKGIQRQNTLKRLLGEAEEEYQPDERTIITQNQFIQQPFIYQQQQDQGQGQQVFGQHLYHQIYNNVQNPLLEQEPLTQKNLSQNLINSNYNPNPQTQVTYLGGLMSNHNTNLQPKQSVSHIIENAEFNNQHSEGSFPLMGNDDQQQQNAQRDEERAQNNQNRNQSN
ncbi:unnamed protein product (macronuclear) [Paramecium tetraurelia]|uniref:Uncharacterized protein n=1 Tax=Paramecium tetraurelia TaxID=5888 RepID=A0CX83_PARTE|nr:uncharacterized protein GSPATT00001604001 [Paramecium tetraurelia]CAK75400.1 unnamed protein product [Paramecium tetraurelia]|eukprot:XP_001442797.1 hypothetical protein (macronuclear) [Paramecium tetraurelia strain d4-2]